MASSPLTSSASSLLFASLSPLSLDPKLLHCFTFQLQVSINQPTFDLTQTLLYLHFIHHFLLNILSSLCTTSTSIFGANTIPEPSTVQPRTVRLLLLPVITRSHAPSHFHFCHFCHFTLFLLRPSTHLFFQPPSPRRDPLPAASCESEPAFPFLSLFHVCCFLSLFSIEGFLPRSFLLLISILFITHHQRLPILFPSFNLQLSTSTSPNTNTPKQRTPDYFHQRSATARRTLRFPGTAHFEYHSHLAG